MFTVVACHRCSSLYRPVPPEVEGRDRSLPSVLTNGRRLCPECRRLLGNPPEEPRFSSRRRPRAADAYSGETRRLVTALKYHNCTAAVEALADHMVQAMREDEPQTADRRGSGRWDPGFDVVTWAPTSARRRRRRGFDQSELLARAVARRLGLPCRRLLKRDRSRHQTGRNRQERLHHGPVFTARPLPRPCRILVIDDVVTTGSTLRAAGHALDLAGAAKVVLFAAAETPQTLSSPPNAPTRRAQLSNVPPGHASKRGVTGLQVA